MIRLVKEKNGVELKKIYGERIYYYKYNLSTRTTQMIKNIYLKVEDDMYFPPGVGNLLGHYIIIKNITLAL